MSRSLDRVAVAIADACDRATTANEVLDRVAGELRAAVPHDGEMWFGVDPTTLLATAPARIDGLDAAHCDVFWDNEFRVQDVNLFRDLARHDVPVAALREATDDCPTRSARYRDFLAPQGYGDELRAVLRVGDASWGIVSLYRDAGRPAFERADVEFVTDVSRTIAAGLRRHLVAASPVSPSPGAPGLLVFDEAGAVVSTNVEAAAWIAEIDSGRLLSADPGAREWLADSSVAGGLPPVVTALTARARAVAEGRERGPARTRLRGRNGRWLVLHATCLTGQADGSVAVVVESATSAEVAPIVIDAYALSPRERDVVRAVARGLSTAEIARELYLSTHTVRDYLKQVFEKTNVSSRGELVAKLFAEHYAEPLHATVHG